MSRRQKAKDAATEIANPRRGPRLDPPSPTRRAVVKAAITAPVAAVVLTSREPLELPDDPRSGGTRDDR